MTDRCSQPVVSLRARPETHSDVYAAHDGGLTRSARVEDGERSVAVPHRRGRGAGERNSPIGESPCIDGTRTVKGGKKERSITAPQRRTMQQLCRSHACDTLLKPRDVCGRCARLRLSFLQPLPLTSRHPFLLSTFLLRFRALLLHLPLPLPRLSYFNPVEKDGCRC